ncbi:MAG: flagellar biosynthesis protein FlhB [Syntrophorhabdales bacterium]|jgi:flagellar biosynthetic protein FlhB
MAESFQDKTEQPTEKRLQDARKKGQVAQSPELASSFVIIFLTLFLYYAMSRGFDRMFAVYSRYIRSSNIEITVESIQGMLFFAASQWLVMVLPAFVLVIVLGLFSSFIQTGFLWSFEAMTPKLDAINPFKGIRRLFSQRSFFEALKSIFKIGILGYVVYSVIMKELPAILSLSGQDTASILDFVGRTGFGLSLKLGVAFLFLAGLDYLRQRWQQKKEIMMTRQEIKEEYKEREGSPLVRSRMRSIQRDMARRRMIEDVKKADLVLANPTSLAIAIMYVAKEMPAPKIVAKGGGFVAERIKQVARSHGVMVIENKTAARALFYAVKVGDYIPEKFYVIVAELLAQVYKQRNRVVL